MIWKRERCPPITTMTFLNKVLWESRLWDLFAKIRSVTLFLKSLNDYKHLILKTTLKKRFTKLSVNQFPEFLKTDKSPSSLTSRVWWLGLCATLKCSYKILICRQLTFAFRDGLIPCSFYARYYFWPTQLVTNVTSKLNGRSRTVILSDDWTISERFWILAITFGRERERTCSFYLFIYLLKKKNSLVYVFFPQMRNISPKALRSSQFSYLKPSQVGILPFHFPWTHLICLKPCNLNPSLHENETNAPFSLPLLCIFPFLRICKGTQDSEDETRKSKK